MAELGSATFDIGVGGLDPFQKGLDNAGSAVDRFAAGTENRLHHMAAAFGVVTTAMIGALEEFLRRGLKLTSFLETSTAQFKTFMGSAAEASKHIGALQKLAGGTIYPVQGIVQASLQLRKLGGAHLDTIANMKAFSNAAMATGNDISSVATRFGYYYSMLQRAAGSAGGAMGGGAYAIRSLQRGGLVTGATAADIQAITVAGTDMAKKIKLPPQINQGLKDVAKGLGETTTELLKQIKAGQGASLQWQFLIGSLGRFNSAAKNVMNTSEGLRARLKYLLEETALKVVAGLHESVKTLEKALIGLMESPAWQGVIKGLTTVANTIAHVFSSIATLITQVSSKTKQSGLAGYIQDIAHGLKSILPIVLAVGVGFSRDWLSKVPGVGTIAKELPGPFLGAFAAIILSSKQARDTLFGIFKDIAQAFAGVFEQVKPALVSLGNVLQTQLLPALVSLVRTFIDALLPILPGLVSLLTQVLGVVVSLAATLLKDLGPLLPKIADAFLAAWKNLVPFLEAVIALVAELAPPLVGALSHVIGWIADLVKALGPVAPLILTIVLALKALSAAEEALAGIRLAFGAGVAGVGTGAVSGASGGLAGGLASGAGGATQAVMSGLVFRSPVVSEADRAASLAQKVTAVGGASAGVPYAKSTAELAIIGRSEKDFVQGLGDLAPAISGTSRRVVGALRGLGGAFGNLLTSIGPLPFVIGAVALAFNSWAHLRQLQQQTGSKTVGSLVGAGYFAGAAMPVSNEGYRQASLFGAQIGGVGANNALGRLFRPSADQAQIKNQQEMVDLTAKYNVGLITTQKLLEGVAKINHTTVDDIKQQILAQAQSQAETAVATKDWKGMNTQLGVWKNELKAGLITQSDYNGLLADEYKQLLTNRTQAELASHDLTGFANTLLTAFHSSAINATELAQSIQAAGLQGAALNRVLALIPRSITTTLAFQLIIDPSGALKQLLTLQAKLKSQLAGAGPAPPPGSAANFGNVGDQSALIGTLNSVNRQIADLQAALSSGPSAAGGGPTTGLSPNPPAAGGGGGKGKGKGAKAKPVTFTKLAQEELAGASTAFRKLGKDLAEALATGFKDGYVKLGKAMDDVSKFLQASFGAHWGALVGAISAAVNDKKLGGAWRTAAANLLAQAKGVITAIATLKTNMAQMVTSVKAGFQKGADVIGAFGTEPFVTPAQVRVYFQRKLKDAQDFAAILKRLAAKGMNRTYLDQLAQAGPDAIGLARALDQMSVKEINTFATQITALATSTAQSVSATAYGPDMKKLEKQAAALGAAVQAFIKGLKADALKHHANAVLNALGAFVQGLKDAYTAMRAMFRQAGIKIPAMAHGGVVMTPLVARLGEVPEAVIPLERLERMLGATGTDGPHLPAQASERAQEVIHFHEVAQTPEQMLAALRWRRKTRGWS